MRSGLLRSFNFPVLSGPGPVQSQSLAGPRTGPSNTRHAHHPRKATPVDLTHQTRTHLLFFPYPFKMDLKNLHSWSHFLNSPWRPIVLSAPHFRYFRCSAHFLIRFTLILSFCHRLKTCALALEVRPRIDLLDFHLLFICCFFFDYSFYLKYFSCSFLRCTRTSSF